MRRWLDGGLSSAAKYLKIITTGDRVISSSSVAFSSVVLVGFCCFRVDGCLSVACDSQKQKTALIKPIASFSSSSSSPSTCPSFRLIIIRKSSFFVFINWSLVSLLHVIKIGTTITWISISLLQETNINAPVSQATLWNFPCHLSQYERQGQQRTVIFLFTSSGDTPPSLSSSSSRNIIINVILCPAHNIRPDTITGGARPLESPLAVTPSVNNCCSGKNLCREGPH